MKKNITKMREELRNALNELDAQRTRNRTLVDNPNASAQEIEAALAETQRMSARVHLMQEELNEAERAQAAALTVSTVSTGSAGMFADHRGEILRSNEYARAFAYAVQNGISLKKGRHDERCKILYDALTESGGSPAGTDGGFLVPEDINQSINELKRTLNPMAQLFNQETVSAPTGWRVYDTAPTKGLVDVNEMGEINDHDDQPAFGKVSYTTSKKALILPVSNELMTDNVANLFAYLSRWFAKKLVITENNLLIAALRTLTAKSIASDPLKGIKSALNVDLDPAISAVATIICNQTGMDILDNLLDNNDRPLLQPDPTNATTLRVKGRPIHTVTDATMGNVTNTTDLFIGDGKEFATLFRCGSYELASTDIGGNAWRTDSTELRGIVRLGVTKFDTGAMVRRSMSVPA